MAKTLTDAERTTAFTLLKRGLSKTEVSKMTGISRSAINCINVAAKAAETEDTVALLELSNGTTILCKPSIEWAFRFFGKEIPNDLKEKIDRAEEWRASSGREKEERVAQSETHEGVGSVDEMKVFGLNEIYNLLKKNDAAENIESAIQVGFRLLSEQMKKQHDELLLTIRTLAQDKKQSDNANADASFAKLKSIEEKTEAVKIGLRRIQN